MHTDEYEISISREVTVCRNIVARIKKNLEAFEIQSGITSAEFKSRVLAGDLSLDFREGKAWYEEIEALAVWQKRLADYEEALRALKEERGAPASR